MSKAESTHPHSRNKAYSAQGLIFGLPCLEARIQSRPMRVLILGCGYVGLPLGAELAKQGHEVFGVRRSAAGEADLKAAGIQPLAADITHPDELARFAGPFDWVVNTVSSAKGGVEEYRRVYLEGT